MKSKYLAGMSLVFMAGGFGVTLLLPETSFMFVLKGGFEAGLVGAIADWFAVTALFRHPFGIPIPHTSLLLKNKEKIVHSLISAMENELLNKQSIEEKLRGLKLLRSAGAYLTRLMGKRKVRVAVANTLIRAAEQVPIEKALPQVQSVAASYIRRMDAQEAIEGAIGKLVLGQYDQRALDYILTEAASWARQRETRQMLGRLAAEKLSEVKMGGLMGFAVQAFGGMMNEDKMGAMLQDMLLSGIEDVMREDSAIRDKILHEVRVRMFEWAADEERLGRLQQQLASKVEGDAVTAFLATKLEELRAQLIRKLEEDRERGGRLVFQLYRSIVRALGASQESVDRMDARLRSFLIETVEQNHYRIGKLVKENVDKMDDKQLVGMLEEKIGADLQWIRVNGALCGFIVGIVLSLLQM